VVRLRRGGTVERWNGGTVERKQLVIPEEAPFKQKKRSRRSAPASFSFTPKN
jgi:hypothetical protein